MEEKAILEVVFYKSDAGDEPVRDWFNKRPKNVKKIIGGDIQSVQYRWPLGMPLVCKLEPKMWEVRSTIPNGIARVIFTVKNGTMVLIHAFIKKDQVTRLEDKDIARDRIKNLE